MGEMADRMQRMIAEEGGEGPDGGAAAAPGTGTEDIEPDAPAGAENTDISRQGPPESIPYSRFQEVNQRYQQLKDYEQLAEYGIEADSALRLANFEASYVSDPKGTISNLIDNQQDLSAEDKAAMKALLSREVSPAGARGDDDDGEDGPALPADVVERLRYVDELRAREEAQASQTQLDHVVRHWDGMDKQDELDVPERTKLVWIQAAAGRGGYQSLEELAETARTMFLEDRDVSLGSVVQSRGTGTPRTVPGGAAAPAPPEEFKSFGDANKQIMADIAAGRLPGMNE